MKLLAKKKVYLLINLILLTITIIQASNSTLTQKAFEAFEIYIKNIQDPEKKVITPLSPQELKNKIDTTLPSHGHDEEYITSLLKKYLQYCLQTGSKKFFSQSFSGFSTPAFLGEVLGALTNTASCNYEMAPIETLIEHEVRKELCSIIGYTDGDGMFTTGGSNGNLAGLLAARQAIFPNSKTEGICIKKPLVIFVSELAHYSYRKAAYILGLGNNSIVSIKTNNIGQMIPQELERAIKNELKKGNRPFFIGATSGTTEMGSFDPLDKIVAIGKKHNCWVHTDAAFGGALLFSRKHRTLMKGIEQVDSVTWDLHKILSIPAICSVVLFKDKQKMYDITSIDGAGYLFHNGTDSLDLGLTSLQCTRHVDGLKLWLDWQFHGSSGYEKRIDKLINLVSYAVQKINHNQNLYLIAQPQSVRLCIQYIPDGYHPEADKAALNIINDNLRKAMIKRGQWVVNYSTVKDRKILRITIVNKDLQKKDIDNLLHEICSIGKALISTS